MKAEEINKLRNHLEYDIENTPNGDRIWISATKDFADLLGKALNELEESEEKSMLHNVTVKHEENKVLEQYWVMRGIKKQYDGLGNEKKVVCRECEVSQYPDLETIAQFLSDSKADFVSVVQNYRFERELPF